MSAFVLLPLTLFLHFWVSAQKPLDNNEGTPGNTCRLN